MGIVGVVGDDFLLEDENENTGLDLSGLEVVQGETFRWTGLSWFDGRSKHMKSERIQTFWAKVPEVSHHHHFAPASAIQKNVFSSPPSRLSMLDSMNLWIQISKDELLSVMRKSISYH